MEKYILLVEGDTNDADYVTRETEISEEALPLIRKVAKKLKELGDRDISNYPTSEYSRIETPMDEHLGITEEEFHCFDEFVPYGEHGIHWITELKLRKVEIVEDFLKDK